MLGCHHTGIKNNSMRHHFQENNISHKILQFGHKIPLNVFFYEQYNFVIHASEFVDTASCQELIEA